MEEKITYIEKIINRYGSFTIGELEGEQSPLVNSFGKDHIQLAERFYETGAEVLTYVHETVTDEQIIPYGELQADVIDEICQVVENYEADQLLTEKRIS